jgi:hypothetical protein
MSESSILEVLMELETNSKSFFEKNKFQYNVHNEKTLRDLEHLINLLYPETKQIPMSEFAPLGYYFGQVITNHIPGACWDDVDSGFPKIEELSITIQFKGTHTSKIMLFPMRRMARFLTNREESLFSFYELTKTIVEKNMDLSKENPKQLLKEGPIVFEICSPDEDPPEVL